MNLSIDEQQIGIRQTSQTEHALKSQPSPMSSFALAKGAGAGPGRVQDVISVELQSSAYGVCAYAERKSGAADMADAVDLSVQHNAMALLSNTMSGADFQKAMEDGFDPRDTEPGESVTIMDHIKAALIKGGKETAGFTDDIDRAALEEITGSAAYAQAIETSFRENDLPMDDNNVKEAAEAVELASSLQDPGDAAVKYMVENRLDPTIRNFYLAQSAAAGGNASAGGFYADANGYLSKKAEMPDMEHLASQIDAVVERAGYTAEEAGEEARWIVANDLPLTEENLRRVRETEQVSFPVDVQLAADAAASAIADGRQALDGNLAEPVSLRKQAEALMHRQELEEARFAMSLDVNLRMLEKGVKIDTLSMEQLIDELKTARAELAQSLFPEAEETGAGTESALKKYDLFEQTVAQTDLIRRAPAALIGAELQTVATGTLADIADCGASVAARFARAEQRYETVGTEVRADLGDTIQKAFRNVDEILKNLQLEQSEDNRRAVRILGYNSMEITEEQISEIRAEDAKLRDVTDRLKPAAVLALIRDGKNPLSMTLDELKQNLDQRGQDAQDSAEKFAKFLYKLEKSDGITPEERESYIGIYRLFHTMERTDHAAIGAVLQQGAEMTIGNLLTAARSAKTAKRGIDRTVDDAFGGVEGGYKTPSISAQIATAFDYYSARSHAAYEHMDPLKLHELQPTADTTLPVLADAMEQPAEQAVQERIDREERAYAEDLSRSARGEFTAEESTAVAEELLESDLPLSFRNMEAMRGLREGRRGTKNVWNAMAEMSARAPQNEGLLAALEDIEEALDDGEHFEDIYKDRVQEMKEDLDRMMEDGETTIELQTMIRARFQLTVATHTADRGSFDIPVEVDGGRVNLHVTLHEDEAAGGSVLTAGVPVNGHGSLTLSVSERDGALTGMLNSSEPETAAERSWLQGVRARFTEAASRVTGQEVDPSAISLVYHASAGREMEATPGNAISHEVMFRLAKEFVGAIR